MIANLKHAARNNETVTIGGGEFSPDEIKAFLSDQEDVVITLYRVIPFLEDLEDDRCYKPGVVTQRIKEIKALLKRIEK